MFYQNNVYLLQCETGTTTCTYLIYSINFPKFLKIVDKSLKNLLYNILINHLYYCIGDLFFIFLSLKWKSMKELLFVFLLYIVASCTTTKYIETPMKHTRVEYKDRIEHDSIYFRDSIVQKKENDTIYLEKYKYLYKYKYLRDTVNVVDSIPVVKVQEITKEVNKLHNWQFILMVLGGGFIVVIGYKLIRIIKI